MKELDIVYTWVDGLQPQHLLNRLWYFFQFQKTPDNKLDRWADRGEIKYSLRALERYFSWKGKIFIVCADKQRPKYIKESERIQFIPHSKIIPIQYLPTFNATVIESFLHRVPNLSEYFYYLNDDVLLMKNLSTQELFTKGKIKIFFNLLVSAEGPLLETDSGGICGKKNANKLLDSIYGYEKRFEVAHFACPLKKEQFEFAWDKFGSALHEGCLGKFRNKKMVGVSNHLVPHLMIKHSQAEAVFDPNIGLMLGTHSSRILALLSSYKHGHKEPPEVRWRQEVLLKKPYFIVVDGDKVTLERFLQPFFPNKSQFEK